MDRAVQLLGAVHLAFFGIVVPIAAIRGQRTLAARALAPRKRFYRTILVQLFMFAVFSALVGRSSRLELFPRRLPSMRGVAAGVVLLVAAVIIMAPLWRKAVLEGKRVVYFFMPSDRTERLLWTAACALAGFGEELTWRGVQTALLARITGSIGLAIALSIAMFSISHVEQGWKSVLVVAPFAGAFHFLVWYSGSLYVAMAVHFLYDAVAGLAYARLGRELGYVAKPVSRFEATSGERI